MSINMNDLSTVPWMTSSTTRMNISTTKPLMTSLTTRMAVSTAVPIMTSSPTETSSSHASTSLSESGNSLSTANIGNSISSSATTLTTIESTLSSTTISPPISPSTSSLPTSSFNSILTTVSSSSRPPPSLSTTPPSLSLTTLLTTNLPFVTNSTINLATTESGFQTTNVTDIISTAFFSTSLPNISEEERKHDLDLLEADTTQKHIPAMIFLAVTAIVGLIGNTLVLLVYSRKAHRNATDVFIMAIAAFDLLTNVVAIPGEIYDLFHFWDFDKPELCGFRLYFSAFTILTSALSLLAVAVTRYKKVCRPFGKQMSSKTARNICIAFALACSIFAIPQGLLNGVQTRPTPRPDVFGQECSIDDKYVDTIWPLIYVGFFILLFISICIPLIVLYLLIGIQAWRHSKIHGVPTASKTPTTSDGTVSETLDSDGEAHGKFRGSALVLSFLKRKQKYGISPSDRKSNNEGNLKGEGLSQMRKKDKESTKEDVKSEDNSTSETENYNTRMVCSPTKGQGQINLPMLKELNFKLNKVKDDNVNNHDTKNSNMAEGGSNCEADTEISTLLKDSSQPEKPQDQKDEEVENLPNSDFAVSMQWVDITYCLNEKKSVDESNIDESISPHKKSSLSSRPSRDGSLRRKLTDTLTRAKKARKVQESSAENENKKTDFDNNSSNTTKTVRDENGSHNSITFNETAMESNSDTSSQGYRKSSEASSCSTPSRRGTSRPKSKRQTKPQHRRVLTRTTLILIIISVVFVIAFVPHLSLLFTKFSVANFLENMNWSEYAAYNVFLRFYYINSAANPIIYSLCDVRFREQIGKIINCKR